MPPAAHDSYPDCMMCKDTGLQYLPQFPPAYRFCACWRGRKLQEDTPRLVDEGKRTRGAAAADRTEMSEMPCSHFNLSLAGTCLDCGNALAFLENTANSGRGKPFEFSVTVRCNHDHLDMDGICHACGADRRGAGA